MSLWQYVGLPDPAPPTQVRPRTSPEEAVGASTDPALPVPRHRGPRTPDGDPYHDLAEGRWQAWARAQEMSSGRAVRYVTPEERHRLPMRELRDRLLEGDTLLIDLKALIHLDAHRSAIRRSLAQLVAEDGLVVFALDGEDGQLLLAPGRGWQVDALTHDLGV